MRRTIVALLVIATFISLSACKKKNENTNQSQPPMSTGTTETKGDSNTEIKAIPVSVPATFQRTMVGMLDGRISIQMQLHRQDDELYGTYFYENIRDPLDLSGKIDKTGTCKLTESVNGEDTGVFKGKMTALDTGTGTKLRFEGTWSKPNGDKPMPFLLQEMQVMFSGGMKLVSKERKEENKKQHYEFDLFYPLIEGANTSGATGFNKAVLKIVEDSIKELKSDASESYDKSNPDAPPSGVYVSHDVSYANDDFISVLFSVSSYSSGAAHPNSGSVTLNYDLRNGKEIKLADLFNSGTSYIPVISNYCIKALTVRLKKNEGLDEDTLKEGAGAKAENFASWNVTRKGLLFTFDPYQVAAYAFGPQEVLMPFTALKDILKTDSPVSAIANQQAAAK
jgi:hypothetical protein